MKKFFRKASEERDRKKIADFEREVLRGHNNRTSSLDEGPLLDPRGMLHRRNNTTASSINSSNLSADYDLTSSLIQTADVVLVGPATTTVAAAQGADYQNQSQQNLNLSNSSSQDSSLMSLAASTTDGHQQHQQQRYSSPVDNSSDAGQYFSHHRNSSIVSDVTTASYSSAGRNNSAEDITGRQQQRLTREEKDRRTKQVIKQQRERAASTSNLSAGGNRSASSISVNSDNSERFTRVEEDKRTKELIKQQRERAASSSSLPSSVRTGAYRSVSSSSGNSGNSERLSRVEEDKRTKELIKQQRERAASSSSLPSSVRTGAYRSVSSSSGNSGNSERLSRVEEDKRTKELIKQQRAAASTSSLPSSAGTGAYRSASSSGNSGTSERLTRVEEDKRTKEFIKQQRAAASSSSSSSSVRTGAYRSTSSSGNSGTSERLTRVEEDKRTKELIKQQQQRDSLSSSSSSSVRAGAYRSAASSSSGNSGNSERLTRVEEDKRTKELIKQQRAAASSSSLPSSARTGAYRSTSSSVNSGNSERLTRVEEDKRTKELIKQQQQRDSLSSYSFSSPDENHSVTSSASINSGTSERLKREDLDKRTKELIKQQQRAASPSLALSHSSTSSYKDDEGSIDQLTSSSSREMYHALHKERGESGSNNERNVSGSSSKREGSEGLCSVLKGKGNQRYSGSGRRKNIDGEEEGRSVSFAEKADDGEGSGDRISFELGGGDDEDSKKEEEWDDSEHFNIDDYNAAIMASAREFEEQDYYDEDENEEELRRSNLVDLHLSQFMATNQISGSNEDFYHESLEGVEEEDEDDRLYFAASKNLSHFEKQEAEKNMKRRKSKRLSNTSLKIAAWHQKYSLRMALKVANSTPQMEWLSSFYRCDPRWQIQSFFDEVAREGGDAQWSEDFAASPLALLFNKANVFTVWRPTSDEAIKNMMLGIATGKGLDIKGKSAKRGNISSYVPFIQIYEEEHKEHVREFLKDGRSILVFYQSEASRDEALDMILDIKDFMLFAAQDAMRILGDEFATEEEQELAMKHLMYDDTNIRVTLVDTYAHSDTPVFGLEITERLFWESYVMMQDCSRPPHSEWDIGRGSEPTFMDFNFKSLRKDPGPGAPRAVVYQFSKQFPMEPRTLLMAYEEHGMVKPVVSDFDCFLLGSRGVKYSQQIPPDQVELVKWSVKNISEVLDERAVSQSDSGWMSNWFQVLKKAAVKNYVPITPKYGNGDPKSYEIIEIAVSRLKETGCVRHGAECFNWYFPQEIDDEFLVISDTLPGKVKWKKMNVFELQETLMTKIDEGFTFPINPKWVLCDPGWRRVYDKLLASQKPNVQDSINCWLPPETGLREQIDAISKRHPHGFEGRACKVEGTEVMDKMEEELERYRRVQALWRKARALVWWIIFLHTKSQMKRLEAWQRLR